MNARASASDANRSGKTGAYFIVLNQASQYGLSFDTFGRECERVTSRSSSRSATDLRGHRGAPVGVDDVRDAVRRRTPRDHPRPAPPTRRRGPARRRCTGSRCRSSRRRRSRRPWPGRRSFVMSQVKTCRGPVGDQLRDGPGRVPGQPATLTDLPVLPQDPVHRGDRAQVDALVEQRRRRPAPGRRRRTRSLFNSRQDPLPLGGGERVRRRRRGRGPVLGRRRSAVDAGPGIPVIAGRGPASWSPHRSAREGVHQRLPSPSSVVRLAPGDVLQELARFSHDRQRRLGPRQLRLRHAPTPAATGRSPPAPPTAARPSHQPACPATTRVPSPAPLRHQRRVQALPPQERPALTDRDGPLVRRQQLQLLPRGERPARPRTIRRGPFLRLMTPSWAVDDTNSSIQRFSILNSPCPTDLL